jgi:hypothetical protein
MAEGNVSDSKKNLIQTGDSASSRKGYEGWKLAISEVPGKAYSVLHVDIEELQLHQFVIRKEQNRICFDCNSPQIYLKNNNSLLLEKMRLITNFHPLNGRR